MARVQAGGDRGQGGATYLGHITAQPDHKIVNKVWARSPPGLENRYPGLARDETRVTTPGRPSWEWGKKGDMLTLKYTPTQGGQHILFQVGLRTHAAPRVPKGNRSMQYRGAVWGTWSASGDHI